MRFIYCGDIVGRAGRDLVAGTLPALKRKLNLDFIAVNVENAHVFINYLLRPNVAAYICQEMGYSTPNEKAQASLPKNVRTNPIVYPSDADMVRGEFEVDLGPALKAYEKGWMELKIEK